jgi:SAM-dependent methyltransferase
MASSARSHESAFSLRIQKTASLTIPLNPNCPACGLNVVAGCLESFYSYKLFGCSSCGLRFWDPRAMPDAKKTTRMFAARNARLLPLEPGHRFFLKDPNAPRTVSLLDVGCGTGNFLIAAWNAGYAVTGAELDPEAARFASHLCGEACVFPLSLENVVERYPGLRFDVVTFFEVLEHQADPSHFLSCVVSVLRPGGFIALSVPNRARWLTGVDPIDYPPNHFLRWDLSSLRGFLESRGFEILSLREQPAGIAYTAQMLNIALRSGISRAFVPDLPPSFRDEIQETATNMPSVPAASSLRLRIIRILARAKFAVCFPLALLAMPYVRWKGHKGAYLYCLARRKDP